MIKMPLPIVTIYILRLQRDIADDDMRHKMDFEDEIERILEREASKVSAEKEEIIAEKDAELEVLRHLIASMNKK